MRPMKELVLAHKKFLNSKLFWSVLALKLFAGSVFTSHFIGDLFIPFVQFFVDSGFQNPWNEFMRRGILDAFPYSSVMLALLTVPQWIGSLFFGSAASVPQPLQLLLLRIPMLLADFGIFLILCRWFETKWRAVLILYWCSPIVFYINYVHGQLDSIPTLFLLISIWYALSKQAGLSGMFLGLGIASKFNVGICVPFILIYMIKSANVQERGPLFFRFSAAFVISCLVLIGPLLSSPGYHAIVLGTDRARWIYDIFFVIKGDIKFYLAPGAALIFLAHFFNYKRFNRDMIILYMGLILTTLVLLVPPAPGWFYWSIPFLAYFLIRQEMIFFVPFWLFNIFYLAYYLFFDPLFALFPMETLVPSLNPASLDHFRSLSFTLMQSSLALIVLWIYRIGVRSHAEYRSRKRPFMIGIGGDSSSGKHTLSETFMQLLGSEESVRLYGDDYHRWPRGHEEWSRYTHLDPQGNYVNLPAEHLISLKKGISVSKSFYDHANGQFTDSAVVESKRFILFLGLHPFLTKKMRIIFDLKIYMDPDENLRRRWKITRDHAERGYTKEQVMEEIEKREQDTNKYIHPQKEFADWVIQYHPCAPIDSSIPQETSIPFKVVHFISTHHTQVEVLVEELKRLAPALNVSWTLDEDLEHQVIEVRGDITQEEVQTIAYRLYPNLEDLTAGKPRWAANYDGITQLIMLCFLSEIAHSEPSAP